MKALQANKEFHEKVIKYHGLDSLLAIGLFLINIVLYALLAIWESEHLIIKENILLAGSGINVLMIIVSVLFIKIRKDNLSSIGLYGGKWKQSCLIGLILASILFFINCLWHIILGADFIARKDIVKLLVYYLTIALCGEIVYRGYITSRLFGLIKNQYLVIIISGILFIIMHFPYRMIAYDMTISDLTIYNAGWLLDLFITHIIFSFIYLKTNSLYGAIIPHWMSNLAYNLVVR